MSGGREIVEPRRAPSCASLRTTGRRGLRRDVPARARLPAGVTRRGARAALRRARTGADRRSIRREPAVVNDALDAALLGHGYAKSALDVACWDLLGKATGRPVCVAARRAPPGAFPLYVAVPLGPAGEMAAYVAARRAEGIRRFQLKLGADPHDDAERVRAVLEATSDEDIVIADANGGWRLQDAVVAARLLERTRRVFFEQPCPTLEECLYVRAAHDAADGARRGRSPTWRSSCVRSSAGGMEAINLKISQGRRAHAGALSARAGRDARHPADDRGHLGRRHRRPPRSATSRRARAPRRSSRSRS